MAQLMADLAVHLIHTMRTLSIVKTRVAVASSELTLWKPFISSQPGFEHKKKVVGPPNIRAAEPPVRPPIS